MGLKRRLWNLAAAVPLALAGNSFSKPDLLPEYYLSLPGSKATPVQINSTQRLLSYIEKDFDNNWPEYRGRLFTVRLDSEATILDDQYNMGVRLIDSFWRSEMGRNLRVTPQEIRDINDTLRQEIGWLRKNRLTPNELTSAVAFSNDSTVELPVTDSEGQPLRWSYAYIAMCDDCDYFGVPGKVKAQSACKGNHPDEEFLRQMRRISTGYHELMHVVAQLQGAPASSYDGPSEKNTEETRAVLAGAFAVIHLSGSAATPYLQAEVADTLRLRRAEYYYNPALYAAAQSQIESGLDKRLPHLNLRAVFALADSLAQQHVLRNSEVLALREVSSGDNDSPQNVQSRLAAYQARTDTSSRMISYKGQELYYPEVALRMDQYRQQISGGPQAWMQWVAQENPLRTSAYAGLPYMRCVSPRQQAAAPRRHAQTNTQPLKPGSVQPS